MCTQTRPVQLASFALCVLLTGCEDSVVTPPPGQTATLSGRITSDPGSQRASPRLARGAPGAVRPSYVTVVRIEPDRRVIGAGVLDRDGRFAIGGLPQTPGPVLVQAMQRDEAVLQALVPWLGAGSEVRSLPLSHETTVEAQAFLALQASGAEVDPIWVQTWVTEELAAGVTDGAALAPALGASLRAYLDIARMTSGGRLPVGMFPAVLAEPWARLARTLDAATDAAVEDAAWDRFADDVPGALAERLGVGGLDHATATAAAAFALRSTLEVDPALAASADAAVALGAWHEAHASRAAQATALAASAEPALGEQLEAVYATFFAELRRAVNRDDVASAEGRLAAQIGGRGSPCASLIDAVVAAENPGAPAGAIEAVRAEGRASRVALERALAEALQAGDPAGAIVGAFRAFEARIQGAVQRAAGELGPSGGAFVASAAVSAHGGISALVDLPIPAGRVSLGGALRRELGLQAGASALASRLAPPSAITATHARLVRFDAYGKRTFVTTGRIDPATQRAVLPSVPRGDELRILEVYDDALRLVGAVIVLPPLAAGERWLETAPITSESTAEALVLAELVRRTGRADLGLVISTIDDAIGAAAIAEDGVLALAGAMEVAQVVRARTLGASIEKLGGFAWASVAALSSELAESPAGARQAQARFDASLRLAVMRATGADLRTYASATAQTNVALRALGRSLAPGTVLAAALEARALLADVGAGAAVLEGELVWLEPGRWIASVLQALADEVARVVASDALPAVGQLASLWLVGDGRLGGADGLLEAYLVARYPGNVALAVAYARAVNAVAGAGLRWGADVQALVEEAAAGVGAIDAGSLASALDARHKVFRKEALAGADFAGTSLSARDASLVTSVLVAVSEGLWGTGGN